MKSACAIEVVAIGKDPAVGDIDAVIEEDPVVMPIVAPVTPSPAKTAKESDSKAEAKCEPGTVKEKPRIPIPAWPNPDGISVHKPWVIFRHVNHLRIGWFDHNGLPLFTHLFLVSHPAVG
jgi:hypothetical protein